MSTAIETAVAELEGVDLAERCAELGLQAPDSDGVLRVEMLGRQLEFVLPTLKTAAHPIDHLLVLHYLLGGRLCRGLPSRPMTHLSANETPPSAPAQGASSALQASTQPTFTTSGKWESFRQFPGGQFYWKPFCSRTSDKLTAEIGNDLDLLTQRLGRYRWSREDVGDFGARINVFGPVYLLLVYNCGDDEFPCEADILFDANLKRIYCAEDAVALAGRLCLGLCNQKCRPCSSCNLCDTKAEVIE